MARSTLNRRIFNFLRRVVASLYLLLLVLNLVLAWKHLNPYDPSWLRVRDSGVLRVGIDPTHPPFSDLSTGEPVGLDVDLARELAGRLGVNAQFVFLGIDGLYAALQTGQVDVLISALSYDPFRLPGVIYTQPYIDAGQVLVSRGGYAGMADLEGKTVAVEYGSVGDELARRWIRRLHRLDVVHFIEPDEALRAVVTGEAHAALVDQVAARLYRRAHPESALKLSDETVFPDPYVVAMRITSLDLAGRVNAALEAMHADGSLRALIRRWL